MLAFSSREFISRVHAQEISVGRAFIVIILFENTLRDLNLPSFLLFFFFLIWYTLGILDYGIISSIYSKAQLGWYPMSNEDSMPAGPLWWKNWLYLLHISLLPFLSSCLSQVGWKKKLMNMLSLGNGHALKNWSKIAS